MKACCICGDWKRAAEYYRDNRGRSADGLMGSCKDCVREGARKRAKARYIPVAIPMAQSRDGMGRFGRAAI